MGPKVLYEYERDVFFRSAAFKSLGIPHPKEKEDYFISLDDYVRQLTEGKSVEEANVAQFSLRHLRNSGRGKSGTIVTNVYPSDKRYKMLKKEDLEESDTSN